MTNNGNTLIADRYSEALVQLAKDGKLTFGKISENLNTVKEILNQSKDLNEFLVNPLISIDDKKEVIVKVFADEIDSLIVNFLKVLVDKNRFATFGEILDSYNSQLDDINNVCRINVTSAVEMQEETKNRLKNKLEEKTKKSVILDLSVNSDIIAGLVIRIGDNIIDMSLKHKLDDLSKNITK